MVPDETAVYRSWKFRFHWDTNVSDQYTETNKQKNYSLPDTSEKVSCSYSNKNCI